MKTTRCLSLSCLSLLTFLLNSCISKGFLVQEKFILPQEAQGYFAVFYGDNYGAIDDTSDIRSFHFDSTGILFTKFRFISDRDIELFLRTKHGGFDTIQRRLYPSQGVDANTIYTSRLITIRQLEKKAVFIYVFYVGVPSADPGKEEFFLNRKLESIAMSNYLDK